MFIRVDSLEMTIIFAVYGTPFVQKTLSISRYYLVLTPYLYSRHWLSQPF